MNGYDAAWQIRQLNKDIIIVAQTAEGLAGDRENAIVVGCNDFIDTSIDQDELFGLIHRYFTV